MNLTDVLPLTSKQIYEIMHPEDKEKTEPKEIREDMYRRLEPFAEAFGTCIRNCGTDLDPKTEFQVTMSVVCSIDRLIREYSKNVV